MCALITLLYDIRCVTWVLVGFEKISEGSYVLIKN